MIKGIVIAHELTYVVGYDPCTRYLNLVPCMEIIKQSIYYNGIQIDWQHPMNPMALTTLERSSHSLMLDQELVLIHELGIATPSLVV